AREGALGDADRDVDRARDRLPQHLRLTTGDGAVDGGLDLGLEPLLELLELGAKLLLEVGGVCGDVDGEVTDVFCHRDLPPPGARGPPRFVGRRPRSRLPRILPRASRQMISPRALSA